MSKRIGSGSGSGGDSASGKGGERPAGREGVVWTTGEGGKAILAQLWQWPGRIAFRWVGGRLTGDGDGPQTPATRTVGEGWGVGGPDCTSGLWGARRGVGQESEMGGPCPIYPPGCNHLPFTGTLFRLGTASGWSPSGARGHRVRLQPDAVRRALGGLVGAAVTVSDEGRHTVRERHGVVLRAWIELGGTRDTVGSGDGHGETGEWVRVSGVIWDRDFPEIGEMVRGVGDGGMAGVAATAASRTDWAMSYEIMDAHVEYVSDDVWEVTGMTFTGVAVVPRAKAAHQESEFSIVARVGGTGMGTERDDGDPRTDRERRL